MVYSKAPIQEAIFDIRIDRLTITKVEELLAFKKIVEEEFPIEKRQLTNLFHFSSEKSEAKTHINQTGFVFITPDQTRHVQVRMDGFTLNVLSPYEKWEIHFEKFIRLWEKYNELFSPNDIIRIASRFINKINLPLPIEDFKQYVLNVPSIPQCLPQKISNFFMQTQVSKNENIYVIITEALEAETNNELPFIIDIDVFQEKNLSKDIKSLISNFNEIRKTKNEVFENCITEKTRKLFL